MRGEINVFKAKEAYCAKQGCSIDNESAYNQCHKETKGCTKFIEFFRDFDQVVNASIY